MKIQTRKSNTIKQNMLFSNHDKIDIKDVRYNEKTANKIIKITDYENIKTLNKKILSQY